MAQAPMDRYPSAGLMADALEATLPGSVAVAGGGTAGAAAGGAEAGAGAGLAASIGPARASGVARSNPTVVSYAPDAYAGVDDPREHDDEPRSRRVAFEDDDREGGTSPAVWVAGAFAVVLLAVIAFFVFQLLSGPRQPTEPTDVTVPNFVGKLLAVATVEADELGVELVSTPDSTSDQPPGTILKQDPQEGDTVALGGKVQVTVAAGLTQIPAPDLRRKTEAQAVAELVSIGLRPGLKTEAFDPVVPAGLVATQVPNPGVLLVRDAAVDYVISKGPEPTPTPSPTATPTPEPTLAPAPIPTAIPEPTVPPPTLEPSPLPIESLQPAPAT